MKHMIIGGKKAAASDGAVFRDLNPTTLELIDELPMATREDVELALDNAQLGKKEWAETPIWKRIEIIRHFLEIYSEHKEELAQAITAELGKPIAHARVEAYGSIDTVSNFCDLARTLGGNDACIALDDCDIVDAVNEAVAGRNYNSGQVCCSSKRFLVHNSIKEEFTRRLVEKVSAIVYGDPTKEEVECGPLVNKNAVTENLGHVFHTVDQGAKLLCGGRAEGEGRFFVPTVLGDVTPEMDVAKDLEIFAPVWPVIGFDTDEEAVEIANQTMYGLSCGIITKDTPRALRMAVKINAGGVALNGHGSFRTPEQPFGGHKMTGIGQKGGRHTLESMSVLKTLYLRNK